MKIVNSDFEIAELSFAPQLGGINPDLAVHFLSDDGGQLKTFWEYDAGTENVSELQKKVDRYKRLMREGGGALGRWIGVTFVFNTRERLLQVNRTITDNSITFAVLSEFNSLHDSTFVRASGGAVQTFFIFE